MPRTVRDLHSASRSVAYLTLAGAPFVFVTCVLGDPPAAVLTAVGTICALLVAVGIVSWARPGVLPMRFWRVAPMICTAVITVVNLLTHDSSTGAQLFYLWPILYAANFLSRRLIYVCLALVAGGAAVTIFVIGEEQAASDWGALVLAMAMTSLVVYTLRERADSLRRVLEGQALADPLTGLANRRSFDEELVRAGALARRRDLPLALLMIDLDHFKAINDTWGHAVGDQVLQAVAEAMTGVTRTEDVAARLGGDEFALLLCADRAGGIRVAEAVRTALSENATLPGGPPSVSIGVAVLPGDADTLEELVKASDAALYVAKSGGRGRVVAPLATLS